MSWKRIATQPWVLWTRQVAAILRLEWRKSFFSKKAWWIYLLALGPVVLTGLHSLLASRGMWRCSLGADSRAYAVIFQLYYLRLGIFFGCVGIFANLFRGEILEKTLHYYLLAPVRRELVVAGKFLAGLLTAVIFFAGGAAISFLLIFWHFGQAFEEFLFRGPGLAQLGWYTLVAVLASVGYGAVFLVAGLVYRNPMIPAAVVMVWEAINAFLPPLLKKISVIFYLKSLCPLDVPMRGTLSAIVVSAEPTPAALAIPGLLLVAAMILVYAGLRARRLEVSYTE